MKSTMGLVAVNILVLVIFYLSTGTRCSCAKARGRCVGFTEKNLTYNCSFASLTSFPRDVPGKTEQLILSHNFINSVSNLDLQHLTRLTHLDLSYNNISSLAEDTFKGLKFLQNLVLSYNPLHYLEFPPLLFEDQTEKLRILMLTTDKALQSGYPVSSLVKLSSLEELYINGVGLSQFPETLANLPLKVLNMQCPGHQKGPQNLTTKWLEHLRNSTVEDISFFNCKVAEIEHGAFKDFKNLRTLNLGENPGGFSMSHFTDPLSDLGSTPLRTLILDHTIQKADTEMTLEHFCNEIGDRITHLSIRQNQIKTANVGVFTCMPKLTYLSFGFNALATYSLPPDFYKTHQLNEIIAYMYPSIQVLDYSHSHTDPDEYPKYFNASSMLKSDDFFRNFELDIKEEWRNDERNYSYTPPDIPNVLFYIPENWSALYARNGLPSTFVGWGYAPVTISQPNKLQLVDFRFTIGKCVLYALFGIYGLNNLKVVDVGYSTQGSPAETFERLSGFPKPEYPNLREIRTPGNSLEGYLHHFEALFHNTPVLESLDLSNNGITSIPMTTFSPLRGLKTLNVAKNALSVNSNLTLNNMSLKYLDISGNSFAFLPEPLIQTLERINKLGPMKTFSVNLQKNPFVCDCSSLAFVKWVQTTEMLITNHEQVTCKVISDSANSSKPILKVSLEELNRKCTPPIDVEKLIVAIGVTAGLLTIIGIALYQQRWRLQWYYYRYRSTCFITRPDEEALLGDTQYDALIIYSERGTRDLAFVTHHLRPTLEDDMGFRLFFNGRDDIPGSTKADEVIRAITLSRKALVLVTTDFVQDSWCNFGIHMLIENGEIIDKVCMVVDRAVDIGRIKNKVLRRLLNPASGISQVHFDENTWEGDIHYQMVFKEKLKTFLTSDQAVWCVL